MSDIFNEVDEEFRRSRSEELWKKYSRVIFAACVLVVAGVAGWRFVEWQREQAAAAAGAQFETALQLLQTGKASDAELLLAKIASENSGPYKVLAQFRSASELAKRDAAGALKAFDAIAGDASADAKLRDVAHLRAAALAVDLEPLADLERRMAPLVSASNPFRHSAQEMLAAAALKANNLERARTLLDGIILDRDAPSSIRSRAELLIGLTRGQK
jgi:hypothetical protein